MTYFPVISNQTLAWALLFAALICHLVGWVFFRVPGQRLMVIHPIWRVREALRPAGVWLVWISFAAGVVAAVVLLLDIARRV